MKSAVETLNPTRVKLTVEVPYEELKPSLDAALKAISSQISIPGFRPGKVPARLVEQRVGKAAVIQEAINSALPDLYGQAVEENSLKPLSQPEIDITAIPVEDGEPFEFTAEVDVRPEITLPTYEDLKVEVDAITDDAVKSEAEGRLQGLLARFGTLKPVERAAKDGDFVTIDLTAVIDGEEIDSVKGISYEIGSGNMLEGMDEALTGLKAGAEKTFSAPLAGGEHEGENADVTVVLGSVKERELPAADDDFAQLASEFDTMAELQADIDKQARQAALFGQGVQARDKVLDLLLEKVEFEVPSSIVEAEVHAHLEGEGRLDDEAHRAEVTESSTRAVRAQLLLDAIVEAEEVQVEQQELIEYLVMTAQQYGMDPGQFAQLMDQQNQVPMMVGEVARRKALASVLERVQVVDSDGGVVDLSAVIDDEDEDGEEAKAEKPAKKAAAKKAPAKKAAAKKAAAKKDVQDAPAPEEATAAEEQLEEKAPAKKAAAKKAPAKKAPAKKAAEGEAAEKPAKKAAAKKAPAKKAPAKKAAAKSDEA